MKKPATLIFGFAMALLLAACGSNEEAEGTATTKNVQAEAQAAQEEDAAKEPVKGDEEETEKSEEIDSKESEEAEAAEEVAVEEAYPIGEVVAEKEFLNYINERRAEAGLDTFVWDDELFDKTSERILEYVEKNSPPERDGIWAAGFEKSPEDADFAKMFEEYSVAFLNNVEGYAADVAAAGSYYSGRYWYWIFDADLVSKYTYTEMAETIYYAVNAVNVRTQPSTDGTRLTSLVKGEAVKVVARCNETGWYRIQDEAGGIGYVSDNYLSTEKPVTQAASSNNGSSSGSTGNVDLDSMSDEELLQWLLGAMGADSIEDLGSLKYEQAWDNARILPDILPLVNNARAEAGVGALTWDSSLDGDAMRRAIEISSNFEHENIPSNCGENILSGTSDSNGLSADACFTLWWNSPGHHDNMLNASYTRISVAIYFDGSTTYASMLLGL